jgi:UDP-3-O-[3-hydroxymyristoyl] glucosamine N-acyltransferase
MPARLAELAVRFGCELRGDPDTIVDRVATLQDAGPGAISFLANPHYRRHLAETRASAVVLDAASAGGCPVAALVTRNPYAAYARIAQLLYPVAPVIPGRHPSAVIEEGAQIDRTAWIGANTFIARGATVGARASIGPGSVVMEDVEVGDDTQLVARVTLGPGTQVGRRCILQPGAVIGADGFGHAQDTDGYVKVPQVGRVLVGDDVEVGCNSTIDRGAIGDTVIEDGAKIDNLVQLGHNVRVGAHTVIAGCTGVSGSTDIGRRCMIGGHVGIAGHIVICDDVAIAGKTAVTGSIRQPGVYAATLPADEIKRFRRNAARFNRLDELAKRVRKLEAAAGRGEEGGEDD